MKKLKFILVGIALLISTVTTAQDNFFAITYNTALTTGETNDFISKYSWGAMGLEWKKMLNDEVSVGFNIAWQIMSQKVENDVIEIPDLNLTLAGTQVRYLNYFPMTVTGTYHINPEGKVIPFIGAGAGLYRVLQRFDISGFAFDQNTWNFGFYPEAGVIFPTGGSADFFVNTKYHYILPSNSGPAHSFLNINVGFSYFF